jgi:hypothetical protein
MFLEGLVGLSLIVFAVWATTKLFLEFTAMPELSDEEWERRRLIAQDYDEDLND